MSFLVSTGASVPSKVVTNETFNEEELQFDRNLAGCSLSEWIFKRYGIRERRRSENELPSDLATMACMDAIKKASLHVEDIDFLIINTAFGDYTQPTTATQVQKKLGLRTNSFAIEINMPCAGAIYGISMAEQFLQSEKYTTGLIVGVDAMQKLVNPNDFRMATLFGDGAGACIVSKKGNWKVIDFVLLSRGEEDGEDNFAMTIKGGKAAHPFAATDYETDHSFFAMNGKKTESLIIEAISSSITQILSQNKLSLENVKYIVPHQAAKNVVINAVKGAGIEEDRIWFTLEKYGNTSAASILITLDDLLKNKRFSKGEKIILAGVGGGLNWGAVLLEHS